jgi:hypothetical protein
MFFRLYCEFCNFNSICDGDNKISASEIARSSFQSIPPWFDQEKKEMSKPVNSKKTKIFKCPKCGRGIRLYKINVSPKLPEDNKEDNQPRKDGDGWLSVPRKDS